LGTIFRLGAGGPSLRLVAPESDVGGESETTIRFRPGDIDLMNLDQHQRDREVADIAGSEFFQDLKERMRRLRAPRSGADDDQGEQR